MTLLLSHGSPATAISHDELRGLQLRVAYTWVNPLATLTRTMK